MTATILRADARALPLPDASVDLVVTSPPYYALRSYTDGGEHYDGQLGSESTPAEYIANLIDCTREMVRVLKPSGSIWLDLGDKYGGAAWANKNATGSSTLAGPPSVRNRNEATKMARTIPGTAYKSLLLLPERYRIAAVDQLGLIARAVVIWSKPNGLPESVTDRVRRSHEDWVHLTKAPRYFSAVDEIRDQYAPDTAARYRAGYGPNGRAANGAMRGSAGTIFNGDMFGTNPLGKLPGSVWTVPTEPLTVPDHLPDHFAAFPTAWPRRLILGWSPSGICTACNEGRRPVGQTEQRGGVNGGGKWHSPGIGAVGVTRATLASRTTALVTITGYTCACPAPSAPTRPSVILDPFGGTGTVALVAKALGRHGISVDRSADYCRLAQWRVNDRGELAKAMRVDKPAPVSRDQLELFEGVA